MTTAEIKALQDKCKWQLDTFDKISHSNTVVLLSLVETLLARQAAVIRINDDMQLFARVKRNQIANILNPENET